ncbi:hypothetical protein ACS8E9_13675 [Pseudomonas neustonica]|uniref:hypothetical protein n=1 Tax=Pseudomonas neustonica TaxID=2487346 RepID=UPI003F48DD0A
MLNLSRTTQLYIGIALMALMAMTRGSHFPLHNLPSASWAVFFLAGVLLRPKWVFPLLFAEATIIDVLSVGWINAGHHCMTVAYWMLVPAYAALWFGGRLYAGWHRDQAGSLAVLVPVMALSALVCNVLSSGGFYFFSGRYEAPTVAGMVERIGHYYPQYLSSLALYVGIAVVLYVGARSAQLLMSNKNHQA